MSVRGRIAGIAAAIGAGALVLSGCAGASDSADPSLPFATHHVDEDTDMPQAEIAGILVLTDGCMAVVDSEGTEVPVVLPDDVTWSPEDEVLEVGGASYALGDEVAWGGAYGPPRAGSGVPAGCPSGVEFGIVYDAS